MSGKPTVINGVYWAVGQSAIFDPDSEAFPDGSKGEICVCLGACPVSLELLNVSETNAYPHVWWARSMECIPSDVMEGYAQYNDTGVQDEDLAENEGIACYDGGDILRYCATNDRWEFESPAGSGTWIDATDRFVNRKGDCIFDTLVPKPAHHEKRKTPAGFRVGANSVMLNQSENEIHYVAILSDIIQPCTTLGGNTVNGGGAAKDGI